MARNRLLAPQHVAPLVRDQDDDHAVEFALDLGRVYRTATYDARSARWDLDTPSTKGKRPSDSRART